MKQRSLWTSVGSDVLVLLCALILTCRILKQPFEEESNNFHCLTTPSAIQVCMGLPNLPLFSAEGHKLMLPGRVRHCARQGQHPQIYPVPDSRHQTRDAGRLETAFALIHNSLLAQHVARASFSEPLSIYPSGIYHCTVFFMWNLERSILIETLAWNKESHDWMVKGRRGTHAQSLA